jgi:hypothetical protein
MATEERLQRRLDWQLGRERVALMIRVMNEIICHALAEPILGGLQHQHPSRIMAVISEFGWTAVNIFRCPEATGDSRCSSSEP